MYRNCCYRINKEDGSWKGEIVLFTWDKDGNPIQEIIPHQSHLYIEDAGGKSKSMFGTKLKKMFFKSVIDRKKWIENNSQVRIFESLSPVREFLLSRFAGQQENPDFQKYPLRTFFFDIEIQVEEEFPKPQEAKYPINVMTFYDSLSQKYFVWLYTKETKIKEHFANKPEINLFIFNSEYEMYKDFLNWFQNNKPDVMTGWNIESFDIPYIINRLKKFFSDEDINKISPVNQVRLHMRQQRGENNAISSYKIEGISILDYYLLYKYKFSSGSKQSFKLEDIGQQELGYGKIQYEGTIKDFYKNNFIKFVEYNIKDVSLCVDLDKKLRFLDLTRNICNIGLCEYEAIFKSSPYIVGALILEAKTNDTILISDSGNTNVIEESEFEGAYVFDPKIGIYRNGVVSLDVSSLYPSIMMCLNISPETKLGKIIDKVEDTITIRLENGSIKNINNTTFDEFKKKVTLSSNGILYINPSIKKGIIPRFLEKLYTKRKKARAHVKNLIKEIEALSENDSVENKQKIKALETESKIYDNMQLAFKTFLNSIYGQMGNKYFSLFDIDNAEAVTKSGQHVIKSSADFVNEYFKKNFQTDTDVVIYGDTDSLYFNCHEIVKRNIEDQKIKWTKGNVRKVCKALDEFTANVNDFCFEMTQKDFLSPLRTIEFKREKFCSEAAFVAKKRYVLHVRDEEGEYKDSFKYVGVDVKKNELPQKIKNFLKDIINGSLMEEWSSADYKKIITKIWNDFLSLSPDDIGFIKNYVTEKSSTGFLDTSKGAGIHARSAIYYNQIIEKLNLKSKYEEIQVGDRLRYVYVCPGNCYGIDAIAWKDSYPKEFENIFQLDYSKMFEKVILSPLKKFEEINSWSKVNPSEEELADVNSL